MARDPLGRFYTPDWLAAACLRELERLGTGALCLDTDMLAIEPSVGGGGFVGPIRAALPKTQLLGVDLDPEAKGLGLCDRAVVGDWLDVAPTITERVGLVVGNPKSDDPLGGDPHAAKRQVQAALALKPVWASFLLPVEYLATSGWMPLVRRLHAARIVPRRVWPNMRGVAQMVWRPRLPDPDGYHCRTMNLEES